MTSSRNSVKIKPLNPNKISLRLHDDLNLKSGCICAETVLPVLAAQAGILQGDLAHRRILDFSRGCSVHTYMSQSNQIYGYIFDVQS